MVKIAAFMLVLFAASSCQTVEPWQRDRLSKKDMQLVSDPLEARRAEQIFFSKEASSGGAGAAGGGCGCN